MLAVIRTLLRRRMRRFYAFAVLFGLSTKYISYPDVIQNTLATGSPLQSAAISVIGAPGFKLALLLGAVTAGVLLLVDIIKKDDQEYSFA